MSNVDRLLLFKSSFIHFLASSFPPSFPSHFKVMPIMIFSMLTRP